MAAFESVPNSEIYFPTLADPAIERVLIDARKYNQYLRTVPNASPEAVEQKVGELNQVWPFADSVTYATGRLTAAVIELEDNPQHNGYANARTAWLPREAAGTQERCTFRANNAAMDKSEFRLVTEPWPETVGGETLNATLASVQLFMGRIVRVYSDQGQQTKPRIQWCEADMDTLILQGQSLSSEYVTRRAREMFPSVTAKIDTLLKGKHTIPDRIMALQNLRIPFDRLVADDDMTALEQHIHETVDYGYDYAQYIMQCKENRALLNPDAHMEAVDFAPQEPRPFILSGLKLVQKTRVYGTSVSEVPDQLELRLQGIVLGHDIEHDHGEIQVRLQDVEHLISIRDYGFGRKGQ